MRALPTLEWVTLSDNEEAGRLCFGLVAQTAGQKIICQINHIAIFLWAIGTDRAGEKEKNAKIKKRLGGSDQKNDRLILGSALKLAKRIAVIINLKNA